MRHLPGFRALVGAYSGFIIDLWGVIHDGVTPYVGAVACLEHLRDAGKPVVLLSNAPRRADTARRGMRTMGIDDALTTRLLTSGEACHAMLKQRRDEWFARLGRRSYHLGPERDRGLLDGTGMEEAARPDLADWVLNTGPDDRRDPNDLSLYEHELLACLAAGLPMLCANPDLEVVRGGRRVLCAGSLARRYTELGGAVRLIGKPDPAIYRSVLATLSLPASRVLAVGDSLRTDIAGAKGAGIASCWVLGGIHSNLLTDLKAAEGEAAGLGLSPVATVPALIW